MLQTTPRKLGPQGAKPRKIWESVLSRSQIRGTVRVLLHGGGGQPLRQLGEDGGQVPNLLHQYLLKPDHRSRRASPVVLPEPVVSVPGSSGEGSLTDTQPTETYSQCKQKPLIHEVPAAYMPSALLVSASMTSCLSATFHRRIF